MNTEPGRRAGDNHIECEECGARFDGGRTEARWARWDPVSSATQQALDHGPMICAACIGQLLDAALDALRVYAGHERGAAIADPNAEA
jgi:hypothetical protein